MLTSLHEGRDYDSLLSYIDATYLFNKRQHPLQTPLLFYLPVTDCLCEIKYSKFPVKCLIHITEALYDFEITILNISSQKLQS